MGAESFTLGGRRGYSGALHVGLVNNMPDAAMRATEMQFARLLKESSGALDVRLRLFSLRSIPRGEQARSRMEGFYDDAAFIQASGIDALIVTGAEPRSGDLRQEPYWPELAHLIDWAEIGTMSTLFSCLAAHAAVMHLDGIARRPLAQKLSGVFPSSRVEDDPLFFNMAQAAPVPQSRRNTLNESDLVQRGYRILSRTAAGGPDIFTREPPGHSRFVFLQGHPEYDEGTLAREYLRDMTRFLRGECIERPGLPRNYFDRATENRLAEIGEEEDALARIGSIVASALPLQSWRGHTVKLFANWLTLVAAAKLRRTTSRTVHTRKRA
jgi:homoserine O-succinyltransferase